MFMTDKINNKLNNYDSIPTTDTNKINKTLEVIHKVRIWTLLALYASTLD